MCDQQLLRPACAYAQTDQSLCLSLKYSSTIKLLTEHHLEFISLKGGCTGSSESTLVKKPHCWKSHVTAQMFENNIHFADCISFQLPPTQQYTVSGATFSLLANYCWVAFSGAQNCYSKTCFKRPLTNRQKKGLKDKW